MGKKRKIKDRVYEITIGGKRYILKEKKTNRHADTKKYGHKDGLSSYEEFKTAEHFRNNVSLDFLEEKIRVNWEEPLGCVVFPDGFQFAIFKFEENLIKTTDLALEKLYESIISNKERLIAEYQWLNENFTSFLDHTLAKNHQKNAIKLNIIRLFGIKPKLSFESFAKVMSFFLIQEAKDLMTELVSENGYANSDRDGYAYRVPSGEQKFLLEIVGMDFEYYKALTQEEIKKMKDNKNNVSPTIQKITDHIRMQLPTHWWDEIETTNVEQAAVIALFKKIKDNNFL